jgi:AraC-like DNA-binding protein
MPVDDTPAMPGLFASGPAVHAEHAWQRPSTADDPASEVIATRWLDRRGSSSWAAQTPVDRYVVRVFLRRTRMRLAVNGRSVANGEIAAGGIHVSLPGDTLAIAFDSPCDSIQWYLPAQVMRAAAADMGCTHLLAGPVLGGFYKDSVIEQLALALLAANSGLCLRGTAGRFAMPMLSRLFQLCSMAGVDAMDPAKVAIPRWRMQRVDAYIREHLGEPISLAAVAGAAGLSPMHFAARFRLATGQRPHHYILHARIEHAKALLAASDRAVVEIAGDVGFRTQAHFTTIFKRLTGATPCAWRRQRSMEACFA